MIFNERLQYLRKKAKLSQEDLAEKISVSRQVISKWELGSSTPDLESLIKISDLFSISLDSLMREEKECESIKSDKPLYANRDIIAFLVEAKKQTYAKSSGKVDSTRPKSHDLKYEKGDLLYYDTYLGSERFVGEEAIWSKGEAIWAMNYSGRVLHSSFSSKFLKEALLQVTEDFPYRGPKLYKNGDYTYHISLNGEFDWFNGIEEIYYKDIKVYECLIHGGIIK